MKKLLALVLAALLLSVSCVALGEAPEDYPEVKEVAEDKMDICARVISVFKCHKACPLTAASSIAVAAFLPGSIPAEAMGPVKEGQTTVRIGHPSGVMTMVPTVVFHGEDPADAEIPGVAVQRTARRIMDGTVYIRK